MRSSSPVVPLVSTHQPHEATTKPDLITVRAISAVERSLEWMANEDGALDTMTVLIALCGPRDSWTVHFIGQNDPDHLPRRASSRVGTRRDREHHYAARPRRGIGLEARVPSSATSAPRALNRSRDST